MPSLPPFLKNYGVAHQRSYQACVQALFDHPRLSGSSHVLWWPNAFPTEHKPPTIVLFVPGNPGLVEFYEPFLSALYNTARATKNPTVILAHSFLGHTPGTVANETGLASQVEGAIEALDALRSHYGPDAKTVLIGHSVGAWVCTQVFASRPTDVTECFLLFPTISRIGSVCIF